MKQLTNYCPVMNYGNEIAAYPGKLSGYCRDNGLEGVELYLYGLEPFQEPCKEETVGVHLKYWPMWMDFWCSNESRMERFFTSSEQRKQYFLGATSKELWLEVIRKNIKAALYYEPEYLVWHVADCDYESLYTWQFAYSSEQVLQASAEVFNEVVACIPKNVKVLFENLWWPGLRLTEPLLVGHVFERLFSQGHENIGIMLDTGHLMNTNPELQVEAEGIRYILKVGEGLGSLKELVQGFHLSCSLSGEYQRKFMADTRANKQWSYPTDGMTIMNHIVALDQHRPFKEVSTAPLVEFYEPQYVNHELYYDNMAQLAEKLKLQRLY